MASVTVLLATCNNAPYVGELLCSLLTQTYQDIRVIVRDDASSDGTRDIVGKYADKRICVLPQGPPSGSAQNNFFLLLQQAQSDYIMFADADDVWLPDKILKTIEAAKVLERQYGKDCPLLVHTDLCVVDRQLKVIAPSLFHYEKLSPARTAFKQLLVQNNVTGCTAMINRALHALVQQKPEHSVMHDWWLALVAAAFGHIGVLYEPLILYRQHDDNQVGAYDARSLKTAVKKMRGKEHMRAVYDEMYRQAECFADTYAEKMLPQNLRDARAYASMRNQRKLHKVLTIAKNGFYKNTLQRNIGQFFVV